MTALSCPGLIYEYKPVFLLRLDCTETNCSDDVMHMEPLLGELRVTVKRGTRRGFTETLARISIYC